MKSKYKIETEDYELNLLGDNYVTEFNITDDSSIPKGQNCFYIGRTFGFQSDTAFINMCLMVSHILLLIWYESYLGYKT